jgi:hypothetical protein
MVHALVVAHGLLRPGGILIDLRADRLGGVGARQDRVFCIAGTRRRYAGPITITRPLADTRSANRAVREVLRRALFRLEVVDIFEVRSYLDSPAHLDGAVAGQRFARLEDSTRRRVRALWRRDPSTEIVVVTRERLNVLVKT